MNNIENKKILLIICGGISAYKSLEIIRLLKRQGATVKSILTQSAKKFVTPRLVPIRTFSVQYPNVTWISTIFVEIKPIIIKVTNWLYEPHAAMIN